MKPKLHMGRKPIDWESKHSTIMNLRGQTTAQNIADSIGVTVHSLRAYCRKRQISLQLNGKASRFVHEKRLAAIAEKEKASAFVKGDGPAVHVDDVWKIPEHPFCVSHVSNFT